MSILSPELGEVFTIRTVKEYAGKVWVNTYEVQATVDGLSTTALRQAASTIIAAERDFHNSWVNFTRYVISTYVPDGQPYNPLTFITEPVALTGNRGSVADSLSLTDCVFVRFGAPTGRPGKRFYRGCLQETDVSFGVDGHTLSIPFRTQVTSNLAPLLVGMPSGLQLCLASGSPNPVIVRPVVTIETAFVTVTKKLNNRYFRRVP